jgi:hypothetical protein
MMEPVGEIDRPLCDDGLTEAMFPFWRTVSPEEFVARRSLGIMCWGFGGYTYPDPDFTQWIHRVTQLLANPAACNLCRKQFLTPEEYERAQATLEAMKDLDYWG